MDEKGQDRCAVSILWQKGCEFKYNTFSAAKRSWKLIEHKQHMRQCGMLCIFRLESSGGKAVIILIIDFPSRRLRGSDGSEDESQVNS